MTLPYRNTLVALLASVLLALAAPRAHAGMVDGPYLIWVNLADDASADQAIHDYTHAEPSLESCWDPNGLLVYKELPREITPELVRQAIVRKDPAARKRLLAVLHRRHGDIESWDGIVVVPKSAKPMLMSLAASGRLKSRVAADKDGKPDWADAFCGVLPPISRKP
jgi:hypothetical protein